MKAIKYLTASAALVTLSSASLFAVGAGVQTLHWGDPLMSTPTDTDDLIPLDNLATVGAPFVFDKFTGPGTLASVIITYTGIVKGGLLGIDNDGNTTATGSITVEGDITFSSTDTNIPVAAFLAGNPGFGDETTSYTVTQDDDGNPIEVGPHDNDELFDDNSGLTLLDTEIPDSDYLEVNLNDGVAHPGATATFSDSLTINMANPFLADFVGPGTVTFDADGATDIDFIGTGFATFSQSSAWTQGTITVEYITAAVPEPSTNAAIAIGAVATLVFVRRRIRRNKAAQEA